MISWVNKTESAVTFTEDILNECIAFCLFQIKLGWYMIIGVILVSFKNPNS